MFVLDWLGQKLLTADCADSQFLLNLSPSGPGPCLGLFPSVHLARVQIKIVPVWRKLNLLDAKLCNIELSFIMLLDFYINERMFWEIHLYMYIMIMNPFQTLCFPCFIISDRSKLISFSGIQWISIQSVQFTLSVTTNWISIRMRFSFIGTVPEHILSSFEIPLRICKHFCVHCYLTVSSTHTIHRGDASCKAYTFFRPKLIIDKNHMSYLFLVADSGHTGPGSDPGPNYKTCRRGHIDTRPESVLKHVEIMTHGGRAASEAAPDCGAQYKARTLAQWRPGPELCWQLPQLPVRAVTAARSPELAAAERRVRQHGADQRENNTVGKTSHMNIL